MTRRRLRALAFLPLGARVGHTSLVARAPAPLRIATLAATSFVAAQALARPGAAPGNVPAALGDAFGALTPASWLTDAPVASPWTLPGSSGIDALLKPYTRPSVERVYPSRSFRDGDYGLATLRLGPRLSWSAVECEAPPDSAGAPASFSASAPELFELRIGAFAQVLPSRLSGVDLLPTWALSAPAPADDLLASARAKNCAPWQRIQPVMIGRYGGESARVQLTECDGSVSAEALDVTSVLARPPGAAHPGLPLPVDPDPGTRAGEWVHGVRLLHPRLLWVLQRLADAFPHRPLYFISGYRPEAAQSPHAKGRAVDLFVTGVENADVFRVCRRIPDVGCGYYPNNRFVHVDLRPTGSGHAFWVDASSPGAPSEYVDAWPGVVEGGALDWAGQH